MGFATSYDDSVFPSLVIELYPEGDLRRFITRNKNVTEKGKMKLVSTSWSGQSVAANIPFRELCDAASGLAYCKTPFKRIIRTTNIPLVHEPSLMIVHRDINGVYVPGRLLRKALHTDSRL